MYRISVVILLTLLLCSCVHEQNKKCVVLCVPVYGQSYALGEEANRITDFDSLANYANGRIVTQYLDHRYGFFDNDKFKEFTKKLLNYQKRSYELSVYEMAKHLADNTGADTLICIFPGGQGATAIAGLSKGTVPYQNFINDIATAFKKSTDNGWEFWVPAICWMQGESDICDYPETDYKEMLKKMWLDMNTDILNITHQADSLRFVCYQANLLSRAELFKSDNYQCNETSVPQAYVDLLRNDNRFWASGPTYPYACVDERIHIDGLGQQKIGELAACSVLSIIKGEKRFQGLIPLGIHSEKNEVIIYLNVPDPPLCIDTVQVRKVENYGFSVITNDNRNIAKDVMTYSDKIIISCSEVPVGCKIRYAVNGDKGKSGNQHGPRGNLRDSKNHWCYQFDLELK